MKLPLFQKKKKKNEPHRSSISEVITHRLETTSILVVIERIYRYKFKANYLKNHKLFRFYA